MSYEPTADFSGTDTFTSTVCDPDGSCDVATVTVAVNAINDTPVVTNEPPMTDQDTKSSER